MTQEALTVLDSCDVIVGYTVYLNLLGERFLGKTFLSTPMRQEVERCRMCYEEAKKGKRVALICRAQNIRPVNLRWYRGLPRQAVVRQCSARR